MRRHHAMWVVAIAAVLGVTGCGLTWMQTRETYAPGTIPLGVAPQGIAVDARAGRVFIANAGIDGSERTVSVLDSRTGRLIQTVSVGQGPQSVAVNERTGRLFVADYMRGRVSVIDTRSGALLSTAIVGSHPLRLSVDPQTARVFVVNQGSTSPADRPTGAGSVTMLDAHTGAVLRTVTLDIDAVAVALDERRGLVLVTTAGPTTIPENGPSRKGKLFVLDARSGAIQRVLPVGVGPYAIAEDTRAGQAFVVNSLGNGGSYNGPSAWYLQWLPHHPPKGTVSIINVTR